MGVLTEHNAAMLEKALTPDEALEFLKDKDNFRNAANGIREWFGMRYPEVRENRVPAAFVNKMKELYGERPTEKTVRDWLRGKRIPSRDSAVKICFALGLPKNDANEFLFNVCKLNGFNFRRAEDIIYAYCLENGKSYDDAKIIIADYEKNPNYPKREKYRELITERIQHGVSRDDYTETTKTLINTFSDMNGMEEDEFKGFLFAKSKYFVDFSVTAHIRFSKIHSEILKEIKMQIQESKTRLTKNRYPNKLDEDFAVLSDVVFDLLVRRFLLEKNEGFPTDKSTLDSIADNFPRNDYVREMLNDWTAATEYERGFSRKTFVLLFFANEIFKQDRALSDLSDDNVPKRSFYKYFYRKLNGELQDCGYGLLHTANPYDWLLLNCVRVFDDVDEDSKADDALQIFNDLLHSYIEK